MPEAHGVDRVRPLADGRWMLTTPSSKGWQARSLAVGTRAHPGTAVLWDGECYEVIAAESRGETVQYVLAEWDGRQAIRRAERYDAESEAGRAVAMRDAAADARTRRTLVMLMFFTGQLPNPVQEEWELRYAFPAARATMSSAVPIGVLGALFTIMLIVMMFGAGFGIPVGFTKWAVIGPYLLLVSGIRITSAVDGRPMGTPAGTIFWLLWRGLRSAGIIRGKGLF